MEAAGASPTTQSGAADFYLPVQVGSAHIRRRHPPRPRRLCRICTQVFKFSAPRAKCNAKEITEERTADARKTTDRKKTINARKEIEIEREKERETSGAKRIQEGEDEEEMAREGRMESWEKSKLQVFVEMLDWSDVTKLSK